MPFDERSTLSLCLAPYSASKQTHTRFINSRDKDHPIMNRRIERITYHCIHKRFYVGAVDAHNVGHCANVDGSNEV